MPARSTPAHPCPRDVQEIPYPIADDYVKDWTAQRAIVELIANALDEDPHPTVTWTNGILTIEDQGQGIPSTGLLLGASHKSPQQIGQFGEGKKLAALVLARDPNITWVQFDTVGYSFTPILKPASYLPPVPTADDTPQIRVLHYQYWASDRTRGTRVRIACPQALADEAISRVRHLASPAYRPPQDRAEILIDDEPGRIYIGGILVSHDARFAASYDLPLTTAKAELNRDRTIVDGAALEAHIRTALAACADPGVIARFVDRALSGPRLAAAETYFADVHDFTVRHAFRAYARQHWNDDDVYHNDTGTAVEDELHLQHRGVTLITSTLNQDTHRALMRLLGIKPVPEAVAHNQQQYPTTQWIKLEDLSHPQRRTLDLACAAFRSVFGIDALGKVRVYQEDEDTARYCTGGVYDAATDVTGIKDSTLDDLTFTLRVVFHEGGHRRAARQGIAHADRSEGFESALDDLGGHLLHLLLTSPTRGLPLLDAAAWKGRVLPGSAYLADPAELTQLRHKQPTARQIRKAKQLAQAPEPRRLLAELAELRMARVLAQQGFTSTDTAMQSIALTAATFRVLANPHPAGYRRPGGFACIPDYRKATALAELLGIHAPVLYLGHIAVEGPLYNVRQHTDGTAPRPWNKPLSTHMPQVIEDLRRLGGPYADQADAIQALSLGHTPYDPDGAWLQPVLGLLHAERNRLLD
ncbi:hypothetical protein [Streptomyces sp. NPDC059003]|uniref:hypothetical protein n=1 Tax=Streptomyces sp. NPDC059003 TaxID=3346691 RepID=UPI0036BADE06